MPFICLYDNHLHARISISKQPHQHFSQVEVLQRVGPFEEEIGLKMKGIFREGGTAKPVASLQNNFCLTHQKRFLPRLTLLFELTELPFFTMPGVACLPTLSNAKWHPLKVPLQFIPTLSSQLSTPWLELGDCASKLTARLEFEQEKVPGFQLHLHLFDNSYSQNTSDNNFCKSTGTARDPRFEQADPGAIANQSTRLQPINSYWEKTLSCICVCVSATEH